MKANSKQQQLQMLTGVKKIAIMKAIAMLKAVGCQFKVVDPEGSEYGELSIKKLPRRVNPFPKGAVQNHVHPRIESMKPCDTVMIPFSQFGGKVIARSVSAYARKNWGENSYTAHRDPKAATVEILRIQ